MPELKTEAEHREYLDQMAALSFFFAKKWLAAEFPAERISTLLLQHTPLLHYLNFTEKEWTSHPDCLRILQESDELQSLSPEDFEYIMGRSVSSLAAEKAHLDYIKSDGFQITSEQQCGTLRYERSSSKYPAGYITFHVFNAVAPHSVFDEPEYLAHCFEVVMHEAELRFHADTLYTYSWLNDCRKWLHFFPQEWQDNLSPRQAKRIPGWDSGDWGQLITRRGTMNMKAAAYLREHGCLPYFPRRSHCSFVNMHNFLKEKYFS